MRKKQQAIDPWAEFRQLLHVERSKILDTPLPPVAEKGASGLRDVADSGEQSFESLTTDITFSLSVQQKNELKAIHAAFERLDKGTYGDCVDCGSDIPHRRLRARPQAVFCVDCQETKPFVPIGTSHCRFRPKGA